MLHCILITKLTLICTLLRSKSLISVIRSCISYCIIGAVKLSQKQKCCQVQQPSFMVCHCPLSKKASKHEYEIRSISCSGMYYIQINLINSCLEHKNTQTSCKIARFVRGFQPTFTFTETNVLSTSHHIHHNSKFVVHSHSRSAECTTKSKWPRSSRRHLSVNP